VKVPARPSAEVAAGGVQDQQRCVREAVPVTGAERSQWFGEPLPAGLRLSPG
jgi:hypothetical protein